MKNSVIKNSKEDFLDDGLPSTKADWEKYVKGDPISRIRKPQGGWVNEFAQEMQWLKRKAHYEEIKKQPRKEKI